MRGRNEKRRRMAADYMARYDEYKVYLDERRAALTEVGAIRYDTVSGGGGKSPVEISVEQLEQISMDFRAQIVDAVGKAWNSFDDFINEKMRTYEEEERYIAKAALWMNMTKPMANRFEDFNQMTMPISRKTFYNYRRAFLNLLANKIGL